MKFGNATRWALAVLFLAQLVLLETSVLSGQRLAYFPGGRWTAATLAILVYGAAIFASLRGTRAPGRRFGTVDALLMGGVALGTAVYYLPPVLNWRERQQPTGEVPDQNVTPIAFLRDLSAAQEQYRLAHGAYAPTLDSIESQIAKPNDASLDLVAHADQGWSAHLTSPHATCGIWVRDTTLRLDASQAEGTPECDSKFHRGGEATVHSVVASVSFAPVPFQESDIRGDWMQHRSDAARSGVASDPIPGYTWTAHAIGELRSSVAVAGNQVFVGAHGNGEFVALSLDKGALGYRLRAPNWIHHEPVVTRNLVILGFGNNERVGDQSVGSPPSGVVAYDRRTGIERWRRLTDGAVMTSPAVVGDAVLAVTAHREIVAWKIEDGAELWRRPLPSYSAMANPLAVDSTLFVSLERAMLCALRVPTSELLYCKTVSSNPDAGWSGHVSPTWTGHDVLVAFVQRVGVNNGSRTVAEWLRHLRDGVVGRTTEEMILVSVEPETGAKRWEVSLGAGREDIVGHVAGTPTVVDGIAYVPVPVNGAIVAVGVDSGRTLWSTNVKVARGSVLVTRGAVLAATRPRGFVVLDARTGHVRCRTQLPAPSDRAGPTLAGSTAILTMRNGEVMARPIDDWIACRV